MQTDNQSQRGVVNGRRLPGLSVAAIVLGAVLIPTPPAQAQYGYGLTSMVPMLLRTVASRGQGQGLFGLGGRRNSAQNQNQSQNPNDTSQQGAYDPSQPPMNATGQWQGQNQWQGGQQGYAPQSGQQGYAPQSRYQGNYNPLPCGGQPQAAAVGGYPTQQGYPQGQPAYTNSNPAALGQPYAGNYAQPNYGAQTGYPQQNYGYGQPYTGGYPQQGYGQQQNARR